MEVVTPDTREQINRVLDALREDKEKSSRMLPDGSYVRDEGGEGTSSQEALYRYFSTRKVSLTPEEPEPAPPEPEQTREHTSFWQSARGWLHKLFE